MSDIKMNLRASAAPQVTDDSGSGYAQGSYWFWDGRLYFCRSAAVGAAVWVVYVPGERATISNTVIYPDDFNGVTTDVTASVAGTDLLGFFAFIVDRPIKSVGFGVSVAGTTGAAAACALYQHDYTTGKPTTRLASFGTAALTSTGFKTGGNLTYDYKGLIWVGVHVKVNGLTTAPTWKQMGGSLGKHVHRSDGTDLTGGAPLQMYSSTDTYTGSAPSPAPTISAINRNVPMPVLLYV